MINYLEGDRGEFDRQLQRQPYEWLCFAPEREAFFYSRSDDTYAPETKLTAICFTGLTSVAETPPVDQPSSNLAKQAASWLCEMCRAWILRADFDPLLNVNCFVQSISPLEPINNLTPTWKLEISVIIRFSS